MPARRGSRLQAPASHCLSITGTRSHAAPVRWARRIDARVRKGFCFSGVQVGREEGIPGSAAEYGPVRDVTWAGHPHVAHGYDARPEGDVAFDLELAAAAQRRRPGGEPLLEVGQ
jgi:hypothetical protein